jgi:hypothetical protein
MYVEPNFDNMDEIGNHLILRSWR